MIDIDLGGSAQTGDERALSDLYQRYAPEAYKAAFLLLGNRALSEDVVQETFIQVIRKVHGLRDPSRFRPWLFQILTNMARRAYRKATWFRWLSLDLNTHDKPDRTAAPIGAQLEADDETRELREAIKRLKPAHQVSLVLYYFNGLPEDQIAEILSCPVGTIKSRLYYARQELHRLMTRVPPATQAVSSRLLAKKVGDQTHVE